MTFSRDECQCPHSTKLLSTEDEEPEAGHEKHLGFRAIPELHSHHLSNSIKVHKDNHLSNRYKRNYSVSRH